MTKASDAAIERVAERWNVHAGLPWLKNDYGHQKNFTNECDREQALSDALRAHFGADVPDTLAGFVLPVVVDPLDDPIVLAVRDAFAAEFPNSALDYLCGDFDNDRTFKVALSVARAIAAQGGVR